MSSVIRGFVKFQDCLGLYQDAQVAMETLRELAEETAGRPKAPAQLLLGIGSLIQVQREIQEKQKLEFLNRWDRFPVQVKELQKLLKSGKFYRNA